MKPDGEWREQAACAGRLNLMVPIFTGKKEVTEEIHAKAVKICERCPVKEPCLEYAVANGEKFGVWGGTTPRQRRRLISQRARLNR